VLVLSSLAGLAIPGLTRLPDQTAILILALLTFVACYRLRDGGLRGIRWGDIMVFYLLRFGLLPLAMYFVARHIIPDYAVSILLLSALPSAVSSPAFTHIFGGAVAPAFGIAILSQTLAPFMIPLQFSFVDGHQIAPSPAHLFTTLVWCIFVPLIIYSLVRNHHKSGIYIHARGKFYSILLVGAVIALAVAKQRDVILADPAGLVVPFLITLCCYAIYILFAWALSYRHLRGERIAAATCSGFNNAALGVSLALMHFPAPVILFVAASEISWSLLPALLRIFLHVRKEAI
jgi:predicted Na+-dependent transporter